MSGDNPWKRPRQRESGALKTVLDVGGPAEPVKAATASREDSTSTGPLPPKRVARPDGPPTSPPVEPPAVGTAAKTMLDIGGGNAPPPSGATTPREVSSPTRTLPAGFVAPSAPKSTGYATTLPVSASGPLAAPPAASPSAPAPAAVPQATSARRIAGWLLAADRRQHFPLFEGKNRVGTEPGREIALPDPACGPQQCAIVCDATSGRVAIQPSESAASDTMIDGRPILVAEYVDTPCTLQVGASRWYVLPLPALPGDAR